MQEAMKVCSPESNRVVERLNRLALDMARSMLLYLKEPGHEL